MTERGFPTGFNWAGVVRAIHAAALDQAQWPDALARMQQALDAAWIALVRRDFAAGTEDVLFQTPLDDAFARDRSAYASRDPHFLSSIEFTPGRVMLGDELVRPEVLRRSDYHRHVMAPRALGDLLLGVVHVRDDVAHVLMGLRACEAPPFADEDKQALAPLLDHLSISLECLWRHEEASDLAAMLLALSNREPRPVLLLDAALKPVFCNRAALRLLDQGMALVRADDGITAASPSDRRLLREAVAQMCASPADEHDEHPTNERSRVLTLAGSTPSQPTVLVVRALGRMHRAVAGGRTGLALVTVRGGHLTHDPATCAFARQYELTAAQARVSALVFDGQTLSTIAHSLSVSENTVRSHLKQVFQKTETHGQMELVHLHARVCQTLS